MIVSKLQFVDDYKTTDVDIEVSNDIINIVDNMNEAFYYEGLVYHGIRLSNGVHGVGIIDTSTSERIWFHPTGVHNVETIKFHQNRLYVKDAGACLQMAPYMV